MKNKAANGVPKSEQGGKVFGANIDFTVGLAGAGTWIPTTSSGYYCDMGVELVFCLSGSLSWTWNFMAGPVPVLLRITAKADVGLALRFGWNFSSGVKTADLAANEEAVL